MTKPQLHVAIIGAGLGGVAAAIATAHAGHRCTILEQAPALGEVGAGIQIPPNSSRLLRRWGILDKIEDVAVVPHEFVLRSYRDGRVLSTQNMIPFAVDKYKNPYLHVHRADYHRVLREEAERLGVEIILNAHVSAIDFERPSVSFDNRPDFTADIIIGADGLKSISREALLGRPNPPYLTGDLAYRILIKVSDMREHPLLKELVQKPEINYWLGPDCHVVTYMLQCGEIYNIVLITPDNLPEDVQVAKADPEEMREIFKDWDPKLRATLDLVQDTAKWRLRDSREMECWSHPSGKFVLLGDAAHATLPYLAQGAAQAIEDGAVIGALLGQITEKSQIPAALTMYESIRKSRTSRVVRESKALQKVFHAPDGPVQDKRDHQLTDMEPFEGFPNRWADPVFQEWLFGYDAYAEADAAWTKFTQGQTPVAPVA